MCWGVLYSNHSPLIAYAMITSCYILVTQIGFDSSLGLWSSRSSSSYLVFVFIWLRLGLWVSLILSKRVKLVLFFGRRPCLIDGFLRVCCCDFVLVLFVGGRCVAQKPSSHGDEVVWRRDGQCAACYSSTLFGRGDNLY